MTEDTDKAAVLERVDIRYAVKASFVVQGGTYNGVLDKAAIAELINERGPLRADDIDLVQIMEVTLDDQPIAQSA